MSDAEGRRGAGRPLRRLRTDSQLWSKVAALWHRERAREDYLAAGFPSHTARKQANEEALAVAKAHGWRGDLGRLKTELSDLLDPKLPGARMPPPAAGGYWEDRVRDGMRELLGLPPDEMRQAMRRLLHGEVRGSTPLAGQVGLYKLAYLMGFIPSMEHMRRRGAFLDVLTEFGNDPACCDPGLFATVFRTLRRYTLKPFEARVGFSMPAVREASTDRPWRDRRRRILSRRRQRLG